MKRIILLTLIAAAMAGCGTNSSQKQTDDSVKKTDRDNDGLPGKIQSIRKTAYKAVEKFGELAKGRVSSGYDANTLVKYDEKGNRTEWNVYNSGGSLVGKSTYKYKYDSQGNWIEETEYAGEANIATEITEREIEYYE